MYDIIVAGAGASGLVAAINAKRTDSGISIALLESLPRVGKKILATGNGRCNLTNLNAVSQNYNDSDFVSFAMNTYSPVKVIEFFKSMGMMCVADEEGRVYPMSNTASSVLDSLKLEAENLGIDILCESKVEAVKKIHGYFLINNSLKCRKLVLSTGGKASPSQGSDGSGYKILRSLGHEITNTYPALVQLTVKESIVKSMKGFRVKANVSLYKDKKIIDFSKGEVLFTDYGISGIAVMDISRTATKTGGLCIIDMLPKLSVDDVIRFLTDTRNHNGNLPLENVLSGLLPKKIGQAILKTVGLPSSQPINDVCIRSFAVIAECAKNFKLTVTGTKGFNYAQVTSGGAKLSQFNPLTLESKIVKNLYCTGELLDIDSICGGFNLQWAWASGLLAGISSAKQD